MAADGEDGVEAAEGKGVGEGQLGAGFTGRTKDDIEIDGWIDLGDSGVGGKLAVVK
jgi:hypothetical protein